MRLLRRFPYALLVTVVSLAVLAPGADPLGAEEGMWTFDNPPTKILKERYGFEPTPQWLEHLRLSSARLNDGGSGSFVSGDGLVLTNHHVASGQIEKLSTKEKNLTELGFHARTLAEEPKCPDLEVNVLVSTENVTDRIQKARSGAKSEYGALKARTAAIASLEKESLDKTGLRSDVVTLYNGSEYWLYRYKRYTDVRLVFAPEFQAAFFGGDPDNFTYPRHDLDFSILRVYENDKPAATPHHLKWNSKGAAENELVFVSGHPGGTERLKTMAQLELNRDHYYPWLLNTFQRRLAVLRQYGERGPEQARQAQGLVFGVENSVKAISGEYQGLKTPDVLAGKRKDEEAFRAAVNANPEWKKRYGGAWDSIALAQEKKVADIGTALYSMARLSSLAMEIVRYGSELQRPDADRLEGFHDSQLESLKFRLTSPAPVYPELDEALLTDAWSQALERRGPNDPYIKAALQGRSPKDVAHEVTSGTKLGDAGYRKSLIEGGQRAIAASDDPFIVLARRVAPITRDQTIRTEQEIESVESAAEELLGQARFAVYGKSMHPDATFTLRLSYGTVSGYPMNGTVAPWKTTFHGLYDRALGFGMKPPYNLSARFAERKDRLDLTTPLNFVLSADIIGGNSGSPVVNRAGEIVGLVFDGNIESLVGNFVYDAQRARTVAVHTGAITEALRKLYDASALADTLEGTAAGSR
ncbi:MAG TPA: S46 family peptidase [Vicinamibacterales bacterium]|nr:S46 family peptidase [Vicinamibacterales bacterium]